MSHPITLCKDPKDIGDDLLPVLSWLFMVYGKIEIRLSLSKHCASVLQVGGVGGDGNSKK